MSAVLFRVLLIGGIVRHEATIVGLFILRLVLLAERYILGMKLGVWQFNPPAALAPRATAHGKHSAAFSALDCSRLCWQHVFEDVSGSCERGGAWWRWRVMARGVR